MKSKLFLVTTFTILFGGVLLGQTKKTCEEQASKVEDLNIINYNKCLVEKSSINHKDKAVMQDRLSSQLYLKVSPKKRRNRERLRYSTKRKRLVKSVVSSINLTKAVKSTYIPNEILFTLVDELPRFKNCTNNSVECFNQGLRKHFLENFNYPKQAIKNKIEGRVFVRFVIDKEGAVSDVQTFCAGEKKVLEDEVKRIVLNLPKLEAGKEFGQRINVVYSMPIDFKL